MTDLSAYSAYHICQRIGCFLLLKQLLLGNLLGQLQPVVAVPCAAGCTKYGTCNLELGRCDCPRNLTGPACGESVPSLGRACKHFGFFSVEECMAETPLRCLNACNGRGKCYAGWCHCQEGEWAVARRLRGRRRVPCTPHPLSPSPHPHSPLVGHAVKGARALPVPSPGGRWRPHCRPLNCLTCTLPDCPCGAPHPHPHPHPHAGCRVLRRRLLVVAGWAGQVGIGVGAGRLGRGG